MKIRTVLAIVLLSPGALAQNVTLGDRLQRLHLFEEAANEYQKAMTAAPSAATLRKLAEAHRGAGDAAAASDAYERLAAMPDASKDDRAAADKGLRRLQAETGLLTVKSEVAQARVLVDGRPVGTTPLAAALRLSSGKHAVRVEREGFVAFATSVDVAAGGAVTVDAPLRSAVTTGVVQVSEARQRAITLAIDGREVGKTPYLAELAPGKHHFALVDPKISAVPVDVDVAIGSRSSVVLESKALVGTLRLHVEPKTARLSIDRAAPIAIPAEIELPVGAHQFQSWAPGYRPVMETVNVSGDSTNTWILTLVRERAQDRVEPALATSEPSPVYAGGHFDLDFTGMIPLTSGADTCPPATTSRNCADGDAFGGGVLLRGGYNFDPISLDFTGLFNGATTSNSVNYGGNGAASDPPETRVANLQRYRTVEYGGIIGAGGSITSRGTFFRATAGASLGLAIRGVTFKREVTGGIVDASSSSDVLFAPAAILHGGLMLGSSPGTKLTLGVMMTIEALTYASDPTPTARSYSVLGGAKVQFGPTLGIRWGK